MKVAFTPVGVLSGLLAGLIAKFTFEWIWGRIDDEEPPEPEHREISVAKLVLALVLEGAIFRGVRGLVDHATRRGFARWSGAWPGEERPERA